jgi:hypothetical protein
LFVTDNVVSGPDDNGVVGADVVVVVDVAVLEVAGVAFVTEATLFVIPGLRGTGGKNLSTKGDIRNSSPMATTSTMRDLRSMS